MHSKPATVSSAINCADNKANSASHSASLPSQDMRGISLENRLAWQCVAGRGAKVHNTQIKSHVVLTVTGLKYDISKCLGTCSMPLETAWQLDNVMSKHRPQAQSIKQVNVHCLAAIPAQQGPFVQTLNMYLDSAPMHMGMSYVWYCSKNRL